MRVLGSITVHVLLGFLLFVLGGALLWDIVMVVVPAGTRFPDAWLWAGWAVAAVAVAFAIPGVIARRRIRVWLDRLSAPRGTSSWEQACRMVVSWLDSPMLWAWERNPVAYDVLREIEPYLRSAIPGSRAHRNLLKLLLRRSRSEDAYRNLLVDSYLTQGIADLEDAAIVAESWDEKHPDEKLRRVLVTFALSQEIDAPWMDKGYRWAIERADELGEKVTRFLAPRFLSRNRYDDLAALIYVAANEVAPSPEVSKALLRIARRYRMTSRDDDLVRRVQAAVKGYPEEEPAVAMEEQVEPAERVSDVQPVFESTFGRTIRTARTVLSPFVESSLRLLSQKIRVLSQFCWDGMRRYGVLRVLRRWAYPIVVVGLLVIAGWGIVRMIPSPPKAKESPPPAREELRVYHSELPFTVQVAAFRDQVDADSMVSRLRENHEEAYWQKSGEVKPWFRVRVGGFQTQDSAKRHAEELIARRLIDNYYIANFIDGYYMAP